MRNIYYSLILLLTTSVIAQEREQSFKKDNRITSGFENSLNSQINIIMARKSNLIGFIDRDKEPKGDTREIILRRQELENSIQNYGPNSVSAAINYDNFAVSLRRAGQYWEAEKYTKKALKTLISLNGLNNIDTAITIDNLATIYSEVSNFVDALPLRLKAVELFEKIDGVDIKNLSCARENLGVTYVKLGDMEKGFEYLKKASELFTRMGGMPPKSQYYNSMGAVYLETGDARNAEKYYRKALDFKKNALDEDSGNSKKHAIWTIERSLAISLAQQGKADEARSLISNALMHIKKSVNLNDPGFGETYFDAGEVELLSRNYLKSSEYYSKGMKICMNLLSPSHLMLVNAMKNYITSLEKSGQNEYAKKISILWKNATDKNISNIITCGTESQRLLFLQKNVSFDIPASLFSPDDLAECVMNWKGAVLDSIINDRKNAKNLSGSSVQKDFNMLGRINQLILNLQMNSFAKDPKNNESGLNELLAEKMEIERRIYTSTQYNSLKSNARFTYKDVQNQMSSDSVAVDIFEYKNIGDTNSSRRYCAILYRPVGLPIRCDLGAAPSIDAKVDELRSLILNPSADSLSYTKASSAFVNSIWKPLEKHFPPTVKKVYINPSGQLNFIPFGSLVDDKNIFLGDLYQVSYITSVKDFIKPLFINKKSDFVILNNPDFSVNFSNSKPLASSQRKVAAALLSASFTQLPGTQREGDQIEQIALQHGYNVIKQSGIDASKEYIEKLKMPYILHLATHGFFLGSQDSTGATDRGMKTIKTNNLTNVSETSFTNISVDTSAFDKNPMIQSGLALAGAQDTVKSWARGIVPDNFNNGILTAEDVSMLDLKNTWLVTLSACESGVGHSKSGEGVFGLRRAFMLAGAQNLLMTLWPVGDETTADFMADFYQEVLITHDPAEALAKVQRNWLSKLREEKGLITAVRDAGPFAMVMMANPNSKPLSESSSDKSLLQKPNKILEFKAALAMADTGDSYAQAVASIYYGLGLGCNQDLEKSKDYAMLSAKQGNPLGIFRLAEMREAGKTMDKNLGQAQQLMQKAKSGLEKMEADPFALTALAGIEERENPSSPHVLKLLTQAAEMGHEPAIKILSEKNQ